MLESLFDPQIGFPVGRVEYLVIQPASFPEFLGAIGEAAALEHVVTVPATEGKAVNLLNPPYYHVSQIEKYLEWFEAQITK